MLNTIKGIIIGFLATFIGISLYSFFVGTGYYGDMMFCSADYGCSQGATMDIAFSFIFVFSIISAIIGAISGYILDYLGL